MAPKIFHFYRKWALQQIFISTAIGVAFAEWYWRGFVVPGVERRNLVMSLIEEERAMKRKALSQAFEEMALPAEGSFEDDMP